MSVSRRPRRVGEPRWLYWLRKPYSWSAPPGWGWEGPSATGRARSARAAWKAIDKAIRRFGQEGNEG